MEYSIELAKVNVLRSVTGQAGVLFRESTMSALEPRTSRSVTSSLSAIKFLLPALLLAATCLPSAALTLVKCKVDGKTVYSDTECPHDGRSANKARTRTDFSSGPASRPVRVSLPRKQSTVMLAPQKKRAGK